MQAQFSRNSPCPCGSRRRYKECCGAISHLGDVKAAALKAQRAGDLDTAERLYRDALELDPDNVDALHMLGVVYFVRKSLDQAEDYIRRALSLCPASSPAVKNISHNLMMLKEAQAAVMMLTEAKAAPNGMSPREAEAPPDVTMLEEAEAASDAPAPRRPLRILRERWLADVVSNVQEVHPPEVVLLARLELPPVAVIAPGTTEFRFPAIRAFELENAIVHPEGHLPTNDEVVVFPDFVDFERHQVPELRYGDYVISASQEIAEHRVPDPSIDELPEAIVMTSAYWQNWAHFLTEVLPKILLADAHGPWRDAPLVVSAAGLANAHALCASLISSERRIMRASCDVRIRRAGYISSAGWVPVDYIYDAHTCIPPFQQNDTAFSAYALDCVRQAANRLVGAVPGSQGTRRIYIKRNSRARQTVNAQQIEDQFSERGFVIVSPETQSVEEQIRLFSDAQIIAGQAGAGLANMVFAPPGCRVLTYSAFTPHANWNYWATIANALGHRLHYLYGEQVGTSIYPQHPDCLVDVSKIDAAIERLLGA